MSENLPLRRVAWLLAVWGFTALVATGQLLVATLIIVYFIFIVFLIKPRFLGRVSGRVWAAIDIIVFVAAVVYSKQDLGTALVYGTAYLQFRMLVRLKQPFDFLLLFLLSFFQVILAAAISAELGFALLLAGFLALAATGTLLVTLERGLAEVAKSAKQLQGIGRPLAAARRTRPLRSNLPSSLSLSRVCLSGGGILRTTLVCLAILPVTAFFFTLVPRLAVRKVFLRLRPFEPEVVTGFSDSLEVGPMSRIRMDRTIVMRVLANQRRGERAAPPSHLRLRGVALDSFEGKKWNISEMGQHSRDIQRNFFGFPVPFAKDEYTTSRLRLRIWQNMRITNGWIFGSPFASELYFRGAREIKYRHRLHSFRLNKAHSGELEYWSTAFLEPPRHLIQARLERMAAGAAGANTDDVPELRDRERATYIYLPVLFPGSQKHEIKKLVSQVTRDAATPYEKVSLLTRFFHQKFKYTLEQQEVHSNTFLANFLLRRREGHCETFATAMAVLCRMVDVPSRVVNGFYTTEYNRINSLFYVRQCNAHTWVEVFIDGHGWMTADPTPPSALPGGGHRFAIFALLSDYWESWTMSWRRYVVDYNLSDQLQLLRQLGSRIASFSLFQGSGEDTRSLWQRMTAWIGVGSRRGSQGLQAIHAVWFGGLLLGVLVVYRHQKRRNGRRRMRNEARHWGVCPVDFYARILSALTREGWRRSPDQTPAEFARSVAAARPDLADLITLTHSYYRVRFSPGSLRADERDRAAAFLVLLDPPRS